MFVPWFSIISKIANQRLESIRVAFCDEALMTVSNEFKFDRLSLSDEFYDERPVSSTTEENIAYVRRIV